MLRSTLGEPVARTSTGDQFGPSNYGRAQGNKRNTVIRNDAQQKIDETLTCRAHPLPIFVISYNRGDTLSRVVDSYRKQARPVEIIIHDNGSNDLATLAVLDEFAGSGVKVYRRPPINLKDELNLINETVADYFRVWGEPSRYVVADCDIDLSSPVLKRSPFTTNCSIASGLWLASARCCAYRIFAKRMLYSTT
jgi:hypothetical protein